MSLRDLSGEKSDLFTRLANHAVGERKHILIPFVQFEIEKAKSPDRIFGIEVPNTIKLDDLRPFLDQVVLIAIEFPSFADGRGFSLAKALRESGFRGQLRAVGPLIADQFAYALACGFDEVEIPADVAARQTVEVWQAAASAYRATYQISHQPEHRQTAGSILEQRRNQQYGFNGTAKSVDLGNRCSK